MVANPVSYVLSLSSKYLVFKGLKTQSPRKNIKGIVLQYDLQKSQIMVLPAPSELRANKASFPKPAHRPHWAGATPPRCLLRSTHSGLCKQQLQQRQSQTRYFSGLPLSSQRFFLEIKAPPHLLPIPAQYTLTKAITLFSTLPSKKLYIPTLLFIRLLLVLIC